MTAESTASLGSLLERARSALSDVPREALGREKTSRWRAPRIVRVGSAWHVGVLLIADDAVFATAEVLRAAAPVRRGYAAESARARAERRAEASRGGFRDGETVHVGWAPIDLYATQFHPEPSPRDFADRMVFYRTTGYFDPDAFHTVQEAILESVVTEPSRILHRFGARALARHRDR